jgi:hypothetical protein
LAEARTGRRFPLNLSVKIKGGNSRSQAATSDLSAAGVFITTNLPFKKGSKLVFEITLPATIIGSPRDVEVKCAGRVIRVDAPARGKRRGVACVIDQYQFVPQRKPREAK